MIEDFTARRRVATNAKWRLHEEELAESELDCEISYLEQDFQSWLKRERLKREEYERLMAEKWALREQQHGME